MKLGLKTPEEQYGLYFSFGFPVARSIRPLIKYHYLSQYLHAKEEGMKLIYAFKGGLSDTELRAGEYMLKDFRSTPRKLALLPCAFVLLEFGKVFYIKIKETMVNHK